MKIKLLAFHDFRKFFISFISPFFIIIIFFLSLPASFFTGKINNKQFLFIPPFFFHPLLCDGCDCHQSHFYNFIADRESSFTGYNNI